MRKDRKEFNHSPLRGIGAFLIAFGLLMGAVMLDVFNLGSPGEYVKWQILLLFIGVVSLFSGKVGEAMILFAVGTYFLLPHLDFFIPEYFDKLYWPGAIIIAGLAFLISGVIRSTRRNNFVNQEN